MTNINLEVNWVLKCGELLRLIEEKDHEQASKFRQVYKKSYRFNMHWIETIIKGKPGWYLEDKVIGVRVPVRPERMNEDMQPYLVAYDKFVSNKYKNLAIEMIQWLNNAD